MLHRLLDNSRIRQLPDCQLADWTTRGLDNSRTSQLADWTSRGLGISRAGQLADATGDFACLVFRFLAIRETASCPVRDLTSPRDVQSASWRIRELSSYRPPTTLYNILADREFSTGCYLFTVSNSGLLSVQRHRHIRHQHIPELISGVHSSRILDTRRRCGPITYAFIELHMVKQRHCNPWSHYDSLIWGGGNTAYLNKIESVDLRKCPYHHRRRSR